MRDYKFTLKVGCEEIPRELIYEKESERYQISFDKAIDAGADVTLDRASSGPLRLPSIPVSPEAGMLAQTKELFICDENTQVINGFDSVEHARTHLETRVLAAACA